MQYIYRSSTCASPSAASKPAEMRTTTGAKAAVIGYTT